MFNTSFTQLAVLYRPDPTKPESEQVPLQDHILTDINAHMHYRDEGPYPHSHIFLGALLSHTPPPHHFCDWFEGLMANLSNTDEDITAALRTQLPNAFAICNLFYRMDQLRIRGPPSPGCTSILLNSSNF